MTNDFPARRQLLTVMLIWLGWYVALMAFQQINWARLRAERPRPELLMDGEPDRWRIGWPIQRGVVLCPLG